MERRPGLYWNPVSVRRLILATDVKARRCQEHQVNLFEQVWDGPHFRLSIDTKRQVMLAYRKRGAAITEDGMRAWARRTIEIAAARGLRPSECGLVIDARDAVGNATPGFERGIEDVQRILLSHFRVVVSLMATAVGLMQHTRLWKRNELASRSLCTLDPDQAVAMAAGEQHRRPVAS